MKQKSAAVLHGVWAHWMRHLFSVSIKNEDKEITIPMELGNMIFGNSRGEFRVPRGEGWENELSRLFDAYAPESEWREYGIEFENDTFAVMPYWWGDCECGYDEKEGEWYENNNHKNDCYIWKYNKIKIKDLLVDEQKHEKWREQKLKPLYRKYGWDTESKNWWHGCAVRCSCSYEKALKTFLQNNCHDESCRIVRPNFLHKPSGFAIQWYKYPLRDSYMNTQISLEQFSEMITNCIESLRSNPLAGSQIYRSHKGNENEQSGNHN